jgi:hypothetical protein
MHHPCWAHFWENIHSILFILNRYDEGSGHMESLLMGLLGAPGLAKNI